MVFEGNEIHIQAIYCPNRLHFPPNEKRKAALNELISVYEQVHIEFGENWDSTRFKELQEEVNLVMKRPKALMAGLKASVAKRKFVWIQKRLAHFLKARGHNPQVAQKRRKSTCQQMTKIIVPQIK